MLGCSGGGEAITSVGQAGGSPAAGGAPALGTGGASSTATGGVGASVGGASMSTGGASMGTGGVSMSTGGASTGTGASSSGGASQASGGTTSSSGGGGAVIVPGTWQPTPQPLAQADISGFSFGLGVHGGNAYVGVGLSNNDTGQVFRTDGTAWVPQGPQIGFINGADTDVFAIPRFTSSGGLAAVVSERRAGEVSHRIFAAHLENNWTLYGNAVSGGDTIYSDYFVAMEMHGDLPVVLYMDYFTVIVGGFDMATYVPRVKRWTGTTWQDLGRLTNDYCVDLALALLADGTPVVMYADSTTKAVHVKAYQGASWNDLGPGRAQGNSVSLAFSADGGLVSSYIPIGAGAVVSRWTGTEWQALGSPAVTNATALSLAIAGDGAPVITWSTGTSLAAKRWTGAAWQDLGTPLSPAPGYTQIGYPKIAADLTSTWIAWKETSGTADGQIRAAKLQ